MFNPLKRQYVSDIGELLADFDKSHPEKSAAQRKEIAKHVRIAQLRDDTKPASLSLEPHELEIWQDF